MGLLARTRRVLRGASTASRQWLAKSSGTRGLMSVAIPLLNHVRNGFGMEISRVNTLRIHQDFGRIGVDVRYVLHDFCLRTVSCSPANQHGRRFGTLEYPTRDDGFSNYFRTAGSPCPTAATSPTAASPSRTANNQRSLSRWNHHLGNSCRRFGAFPAEVQHQYPDPISQHPG
jgi:hypothetical protein